MIPLVLSQNFTHILNFFILILKWREAIHQRRSNSNLIELFSLMTNNMNMTLNALQLIALIMRWVRLRKAKKLLLKPHLLLPLLGGYR